MQLFLCASENDTDQRLLGELLVHLAQQERSGQLRPWSQKKVPPGARVQAAVAAALADANVAILWLSPELLADPQILDLQVPVLLEREAAGELHFLPVLARSCDWSALPAFEGRRLLPLDGRPLHTLDLPQRDAALVEICRALAALPAPVLKKTVSGGAPRLALAPPGGPFDDLWYVPRPDLLAKAQALLGRPGAPVVLFAPERGGKSWFLRDLLRQLYEEDGEQARIVEIDLGEVLRDPPVGPHPFWRGFAGHLIDALAGYSADAGDWPRLLQETWSRIGTPLSQLKWLVQRILLRCPGRLVLAVDGADAAVGTPYQQDFYAMLRGWAEAGGAPPFDRLRIVMAVASSPQLLIDTLTTSPFNLTQALVLGDLDAAQIDDLARRHGLGWGAAEREALRALVGGHPYLVRLVMHKVSRDGTPLAELLEDRRASRELFKEFLGRYAQTLDEDAELRRVLKTVAESKPVGKGQQDALRLHRLERAGLIVRDDEGRPRLRCALFRRLLQEENG